MTEYEVQLPDGSILRGAEAASYACTHYRTVAGAGPAACGVQIQVGPGGHPYIAGELGPSSTSVLDRVTCEACKKAAPGMKYDGEKPRMSLLPFGALELVARVMTYGARKYAPHNWKRLSNGKERAANAMLRHFAAWQQGQRFDEESGLHHLAQVCCNALFLLAFDEQTDGVREEDIQ